jgi:hypothetical protein
MKAVISSVLKFSDHVVSEWYLRNFQERSALVSLYFHGLFLDEAESEMDVVDPHSQRSVTVEHFREVVDYYLNSNYIFISSDDILRGLDEGKNYVLISFDDGYFNNQHALSVLKEYDVPGTFFVSTNHVMQNKAFWWDTLFRKRRRSGMSFRTIFLEMQHLKEKAAEDIEEYMISTFGPFYSHELLFRGN